MLLIYESLIDYVNKIRTEKMFQKFIDQAKIIKEEDYELDKKRPM